MFEKKKRIVNKKLLEEIKMQSCVVCNKKPVDAHHLSTKGSGGDDTKENCFPFCREHHSMIHRIGINSFIQTFPRFETKMRNNGWEIIEGRWRLLK